MSSTPKTTHGGLAAAGRTSVKRRVRGGAVGTVFDWSLAGFRSTNVNKDDCSIVPEGGINIIGSGAQRKHGAIHTKSKLDILPDILAEMLREQDIREGALFPNPVMRQLIPQFRDRVRVGVSPEKIGRGSFATSPFKAGELVCVIGGNVAAKGAHNSFTFEIWDGGPVLGEAPNDDPFTWWGACNQYVWSNKHESEGNSLRCIPGGVIVASRDIEAGEELFIHYGMWYDWDPAMLVAAKQLLPHVLEAAVVCKMADTNGLVSLWEEVALHVTLLEAKVGGPLSRLIADFISGTVKGVHLSFPYGDVPTAIWLESLLRCRPFISQFSFRGLCPSTRLPVKDSLLKQPESIRPRRLASLGVDNTGGGVATEYLFFFSPIRF